MRDNLDSREKLTEAKDQAALNDPGWDLSSSEVHQEVPAGFGAHFPTNPPWQARRAGWRMFVQRTHRQ
jgi:hypothetical protein